jgi:hypothetical protein
VIALARDSDGTTVHGIARTRSIVTRSIAKDRGMGPVAARVAKREAHHRHRRAWNMWLRAGDPERNPPRVSPANSWDVW